MNTFQKLVSRGNAVMREWSDHDGMEPYHERMIAELAATGLASVCGEDMKNWSIEAMKDKAHFMKVLVTCAFQLGKGTESESKHMVEKHEDA